MDPCRDLRNLAEGVREWWVVLVIRGYMEITKTYV
jgi:hypothetical protein